MRLFQKKYTPKPCHICGKELSRVGNYTNMILTDIKDPKEFDDSYGMKCAEHSSELTQIIIEEHGISDAEFEKAFETAKILAYRDMS